MGNCDSLSTKAYNKKSNAGKSTIKDSRCLLLCLVAGTIFTVGSVFVGLTFHEGVFTFSLSDQVLYDSNDLGKIWGWAENEAGAKQEYLLDQNLDPDGSDLVDIFRSARVEGKPCQFELYLEFCRGFPFVWIVYFEDSSPEHVYGFNHNISSGALPVVPRFLSWRIVSIALIADIFAWSIFFWLASKVFVTVRRTRRVRHGLCRNCGYDLRGSTGRICSECGYCIGDYWKFRRRFT